MAKSNMSGDWTSGHWTDEQLIAQFYAVGPEDDHFKGCAECQARAAAMMGVRRSQEQAAREQAVLMGDQVSFDFLAAQRRRIYARLTQPVRIGFRRLASAVAAVLVIGAGVLTYQEQQQHQSVNRIMTENHISDAQLASEVAQMGQDSDPAPVAPIQELFE
jgi:hypothetical protein